MKWWATWAVLSLKQRPALSSTWQNFWGAAPPGKSKEVAHPLLGEPTRRLTHDSPMPMSMWVPEKEPAAAGFQVPFYDRPRKEAKQEIHSHRRNSPELFLIELKAQDKYQSWKLQPFPRFPCLPFTLGIQFLIQNSHPRVKTSKYTRWSLNSSSEPNPLQLWPSSWLFGLSMSCSRNPQKGVPLLSSGTQLHPKPEPSPRPRYKEGKGEVEIDSERQLKGLPTQSSGEDLKEPYTSFWDHAARPVRAEGSGNSSVPTRTLGIPVSRVLQHSKSQALCTAKYQIHDLGLRSTQKKSDKIHIY